MPAKTPNPFGDDIFPVFSKDIRNSHHSILAHPGRKVKTPPKEKGVSGFRLKNRM
jgi:hypothetical protein